MYSCILYAVHCFLLLVQPLPALHSLKVRQLNLTILHSTSSYFSIPHPLLHTSWLLRAEDVSVSTDNSLLSPSLAPSHLALFLSRLNLPCAHIRQACGRGGALTLEKSPIASRSRPLIHPQLFGASTFFVSTASVSLCTETQFFRQGLSASSQNAVCNLFECDSLPAGLSEGS